ncbi:MAG TPA: hypothetical protein VHI13_11730 [Candidatus Kapabacteria bacterium]|nr:hypothetical protein [Candidatus Kapabacteria bacterium]
MRATLATRDATVETTIQVPDGGFRILRFIPTGFVAAKLLVDPEHDTASDLIEVSWKCEQDRLGSTNGAISLWSLAKLHESPLWTGEWFAERKRLVFDFTITSDRTALTLPAAIGYDIWGVIGDEIDTLDYVRYGSYRSLAGAHLLAQLLKSL